MKLGGAGALLYLNTWGGRGKQKNLELEASLVYKFWDRAVTEKLLSQKPKNKQINEGVGEIKNSE